MAKEEKQCYSYTFALKPSEWDVKKLEKIFKTEYHAYSLAFSYYYKQVKGYREEPQLIEITERHRKLAEENDKKPVPYTNEEKEILKGLQNKHELRGSHPSKVLSKRLRTNFKEILDSNMVQFAIDCVYNGVHKILFTKDDRSAAKKKKGPRMLHKTKFQDFTTINMCTNISGCVVKKIDGVFYLDYRQTGRKGKVKFSIPIKTATGKEPIDYMLEFCPIKYPVLKRVRTKKGWKYQVQLLFDGVPSRDNLEAKDAIVGVDITEAHIAVVTDDYVGYQRLYSVPDAQTEKLEQIQQQMDVLQREDNPENYNEDGTISKGRKKWTHSKQWYRLRDTQKVLREHNANKLIYNQNCLANTIVNKGNNVRIIKKDFQFKRKKAEETTIDEKGRYEDKSSLSAKPIANNAPARLVEKIAQREKYISGSVAKIADKDEPIYSIDIFTGEQLPYTAEDEYYMVDGRRIHRTVYYAFIMRCYNVEEHAIDYDLAQSKFEDFYTKYLDLVDSEENIKEADIA